jgi:hypothetical protein
LTGRVERIAGRFTAYPVLPAVDGSRYSVRRLTVVWLLEPVWPPVRPVGSAS